MVTLIPSVPGDVVPFTSNVGQAERDSSLGAEGWGNQ